MRFDGKVAMVTGGGLGIGRATVLRLASEGAAVAVVDIDLGAAQAAVRELEASGGKGLAILADVSDEAAGRAAVERTVQELGGLHVLVNNAGLPAQHREESAFALWELGLRQTLSSAYFMAEHAIPHLAAAGGGAIVSTCSIAGTMVAGPVAWYSASKAGITGLTRSLAGSYSRRGVRVNAVCPGAIETRRTQFIRDVPRAAGAWDTRTLLGRMGRPEEVASVTAFLASDDASYMTGQVLVIDGGYTIGA